MFLIGGIVTVGALSYSSLNQKLAEANPEIKDIEITFASELKNGDMRSIKVGDGDSDKVLISRY